ncbi:hypothetical protein YC2023_121301 [Brassica napus]
MSMNPRIKRHSSIVFLFLNENNFTHHNKQYTQDPLSLVVSLPATKSKLEKNKKASKMVVLSMMALVKTAYSLNSFVFEAEDIVFGSPWWFVVVSVACLLVLFAGIMSGLTLGLMSLGLVELEILQQSGSSAEKKQAVLVSPHYVNSSYDHYLNSYINIRMLQNYAQKQKLHLIRESITLITRKKISITVEKEDSVN